MTYQVRTAEHVLTVEISDDIAGRLIHSGCGHWAEFTLANPGKVQAYVIDVNQVFTIGDDRVRIFFWADSYIYKKVRS